MKDVESLLGALLRLGPLALLGVFLMAVTYLIRASNFSNRWIPWAIAVMGPVILEGLFPVRDLSENWGNPRLVIAIYGFIVSVAVWAAHEFVLSRIEDWAASKGWFPKRLQRAPDEEATLSSPPKGVEPSLEKNQNQNT